MLGKSKTLYFPTLKYIEKVHFKNFDNYSVVKEVALYSLDWSKKDNKCKSEHEAWLINFPQKPLNIPFMPSLPEKYDAKVKSLTFAITKDYMREINRNSSRATEEWEVNRPFDTTIREMCLGPSISHVLLAFKLLADCIYDSSTNYYSRNSWDKYSIGEIMAYKFWAHQTGRGLIWNNAGFEKIERMMTNTNKYYKEASGYSKEIIEDFKKFEKEWDEAYAGQTIPYESVVEYSDRQKWLFKNHPDRLLAWDMGEENLDCKEKVEEIIREAKFKGYTILFPVGGEVPDGDISMESVVLVKKIDGIEIAYNPRWKSILKVDVEKIIKE